MTKTISRDELKQKIDRKDDFLLVETLPATASQLLHDIATLMLQTGMRPEEVCKIRRSNINLEQGYILNPFW